MRKYQISRSQNIVISERKVYQFSEHNPMAIKKDCEYCAFLNIKLCYDALCEASTRKDEKDGYYVLVKKLNFSVRYTCERFLSRLFKEIKAKIHSCNQ